MSDERTNYKSEFGTIRLFGKKIVEEEPKRCEWKEEVDCKDCWYFSNNNCCLNNLKEMIEE